MDGSSIEQFGMRRISESAGSSHFPYLAAPVRNTSDEQGHTKGARVLMGSKEVVGACLVKPLGQR